MYLRTQNDEAVFDLNMFASIAATEDGCIYVTSFSGTSFLAGKYKTFERAKDVVGEIYAVMDVTSRYDMPII